MASTSDKRRAVEALAAEKNRQGAVGRFAKRAGGVLAVLALIAMPVLWLMGFFSSPKAVAEIEQVVNQQVAEYDRVARGEVPFASAPSTRTMFEKMREVPPQYRDQVGQQMGRVWEARERAESASYFALAPDKRQAELDRRIKADEERRKQWQAERERRDQERSSGGQQADGGRGGPGGGPPGGGPGGGGPGGGGPGGGATAGGNRRGSEEARNERTKRRLDQSTPEQRAQRSEYRRAMEERRTQLGLSSGGRRG
jgi:uncharacterized membrane protein YgcG